MEYCGSEIELKEAKQDGKKNDKDKKYQDDKIKSFIEVLCSCLSSQTFENDKVTQAFDENDRKSINCMILTFKFLSTIQERKLVSIRMSMLILNSNELRNNGWKVKAESKIVYQSQDDRGGRNNKRDKRYQDDYDDYDNYDDYDSGYNYKEYQPKSQYEAKGESKYQEVSSGKNNSKNDSLAHVEIKEKMLELKKYDKFESYETYFSNSTKALENESGKSVLDGFLKNFIDCSQLVAFTRSKVPSLIVKNFNLSENEFFTAYKQFTDKSVYEDVPFLRKCLGKMLVSVVHESKFKIENIEFAYSDTEETREDQVYFYIDIIDEFIKEIKTIDSNSEAISAAESIKTQIKSKK